MGPMTLRSDQLSAKEEPSRVGAITSGDMTDRQATTP
jgi:hypothetical protein